MKFQDMPEGQRARWLAWANSHHWGGGPARFVTVGGCLSMRVEMGFFGSDEIEVHHSHTPADLRSWAGY
ncbi:MAG TPA: hypothetical protein VFW22_16260 [Pseudolabrys sp.]|nr:hypothetical protein [Pseudolabrys sp.]